MEIGIRGLKNRLSEILHRANSGETVIITHHGQPLCQITPIERPEHQIPAFLQEAAAEGWLIPATTSGLKKIQGFKPKSSGPTTEEVLRAGRRDRF